MPSSPETPRRRCAPVRDLRSSAPVSTLPVHCGSVGSHSFQRAALIRFLLSFLHRVSSLDLLQIKFGPSLRVDIRQVLWPLLTSRSSLLLLAFARLRDLSSYGHTLSILCLPDLPWAISDSYRTSISLAILSSPIGLISDFCPSDQMFAAGFLQIPSRGGHPCLWL